MLNGFASRLKTVLWRLGHVWRLSVVGCALLVVGCAGVAPSLDSVLAHRSDAAKRVMNVQGWDLATVRMGQGPVRRIYIEGDGRAYIDRATPSGDPTPLKAVGLELALADTEGGVLYVARPCQWVRGAECKDWSLWTRGRFTQDVVDRYVALVAQESAGRAVELVGFSGGAWVALQVAARLENVTRVVMVAGNLMPNWVNAQHKVTPMDVEAYPAFTRQLPVVAYVGREDKIVGRGVVEAFEQASGLRVDVREVDASHSKGWDGFRVP